MKSTASSLLVASPPLGVRGGLFLLSAATLTFEITLSRLFAVAQFYHFAFMIVSIALLGFGASGTVMAIFPARRRRNIDYDLSWLSLGTGVCILGAYLLTNWLPFDSFSIAWERKQVFILILHYVALATPFFFSGMAVSHLLTSFPQVAGKTYAINLIGSALGCAIAMLAPLRLGGEGTVILSVGLASLASLICLMGKAEKKGESMGMPPSGDPAGKPALLLVSSASISRLSLMFARLIVPATLLIFTALDLSARLRGKSSFSWLELQLSPYKGLSYALQYPGAEIISQRWNSFSRVDVVRSAGIRSLPGLSYRYLNLPPLQDGLLVDGDDLNPIAKPDMPADFVPYLPAAAAFQLRPHATTLILEARGGLDILSALALGASQVTAVEANPLIVQAASAIYNHPQVTPVVEDGRSYIRRQQSLFDVVVLSLASSYHPIRSGAYSLAEDYRYTVEAFRDLLKHLQPGGLLVITRWLQTPPSEEMRAFALAVTALEGEGAHPANQIVAWRGYNTATLLVKNGIFTTEELASLREFTVSRAFDLVYAPDIQADEVNRFNILKEPVYYQLFQQLLAAPNRQDFYAAYPFEITPPTDNRPFFNHYFKWSQAKQVLAEIGKTWQPFGGAGYFVILMLLLLVTLLAGVLIILPAMAFHWRRPTTTTEPAVIGKPPVLRAFLPYLGYFSGIGLAYLLVEIPLIQRFILYLGQPAYAFTTVLFTLLLFSGLGSQFSERFNAQWSIGCLVLLVSISPFLLPVAFERTLGLALGLRLLLAIVLLAPLGFLMGMPFPRGIQQLQSQADTAWIPWIWAVNGSASVVASVLAALLALSLGFNGVLWLGAAGYLLAWFIFRGWAQSHRS